MSEKIRTIRVYGRLGAKFGCIHRLAVNSTAEAIPESDQPAVSCDEANNPGKSARCSGVSPTATLAGRWHDVTALAARKRLHQPLQ